MATLELPEGLPDFGSSAVKTPSVSFAHLNPEQKLIVADVTSKVTQVIAGAGCGKTTGAILPKAQALYHHQPGLVAILAFNTSVKDELQNKVETMLDPVAASKTTAYTIAGLARRLVLNGLHHFGLPADSELVTEEWKIIKFLKEQMETQSGLSQANRIPHFQPVFNSFTDAQIKALFKANEVATAQGKPIEDIYKNYEVLSKLDPAFVKDFVFWNRAIRLSHGKLMWRDLLPLAAALPQESYDSLNFRHVLVDEAQDLSVEQHDMIRKLADSCSTLTFVGDPSQCIYKWAGARPDLFMGIPKMYPGTQVFYLQTNYRSDQQVLDVANHILAKVLNSPIRVQTPGPKPGEPIHTMPADNQQLVAWVQELLENGFPPEEIAVLARVNAHMLDIEIAFSQAGIPYQCWSGSFFDHSVVNDIMAILRTVWPDDNVGVDEDDWKTVVGHTKWLGKKTIEETWERSPGDPLSNTAVPQACRSFNQRKLWADLLHFLDRLDRVLTGKTASVLSVITSRLEEFWENQFADDPQKRRECREVCEAFITWAAGFTHITEVLAAANTMKASSDKGVVLSTVHKAKGLEWDCVALWKVGPGFPMQWERADPEEEACIFYVAATRAKFMLTMCYQDHAGQIPYQLDTGLCPAQYVITESLVDIGKPDTLKPLWGMYDVCKRCPRQLECLVSSQGPL